MDVLSLFYSLIATIIVSLISLVGAITLLFSKKKLDKIILGLVGLSAGTLMGGAFLHLIPESIELSNYYTVAYSLLIGFILFFILERLLHWRHCHENNCKVHTVSYMNLVGDSIHNFLDGIIISASFVTDFALGISTTIAVIMHEIPQEMGDFGVLIHGGFSKKKAILMNFFVSTISIIGAIFGFFLINKISFIESNLLAFAAAGFIYIALSDLIPEIHREVNINKAIFSIVMFIIGILIMAFLI